MRVIVTLIALSLCYVATAADRHVVLVTLDGVRWQDVFRGAQASFVADERFVQRRDEVRAHFVAVPDPARTLTPFLHDVVAKQGVLIGNRDAGSCARVTNPYWFSYPGYNEILTGRADPRIDSNDKVDNPNVTVLEWLDSQSGLRGKVRAFGSWDVFPSILNRKRSGLTINAGFESLEPPRNEFERTLNRVQADLPPMFHNVRYDAFTFHFAMESLRRDHPRVIYIGLGETDDFAHERRYDQYLYALQRSDRFLRELWTGLQNDAAYRGKTTLIVTTDHGRGEGDQWHGHGSARNARGAPVADAEAIPGSDAVWMGMIGPDIATDAGMFTPANCARSDQIAATLLASLGIDWRSFDDNIGAPLAR